MWLLLSCIHCYTEYDGTNHDRNTGYKRETHCYGWETDWTTRPDINSDPCFFRFSVLVSVQKPAVYFIIIMVIFFFNYFPALSLYCWGTSGSLALGKYQTWYCGAVEPLLSSYPFHVPISLQRRRFLDDALTQSLDKKCLLHRLSRLDFHGSPRWSWNAVPNPDTDKGRHVGH